MLFDSLTHEEVVDSESALEFMKEATKLASSADLEDLSERVSLKAECFNKYLNQTSVEELKEEQFDRIVQLIFSIGRKSKRLIAANGFENLRFRISELLHFSKPERYWLWTNWIWDPDNNTGALPLVIQEEVDLLGETEGETYLRVGEAMAYVHQVGNERGYSRVGHGTYGIDVFLACVYAVYMYTVFRVKLSDEFNRILPELPELTRRVLGVQKMEL